MRVLRHTWFLLLLCAYSVTSAAATDPPAQGQQGSENKINTQVAVEKAEPATAARGETITITGNFPVASDVIAVALKRLRWGTQGIDTTVSAEGDKGAAETISVGSLTTNTSKTALSFTVPFNVPLGRYQVLVSITDKSKATFTVPVMPDGSLHVISKEAVKISSVYPSVSYPDKDHFEFTITGEGFSYIKEDNALVIEGRPTVTVCSEKVSDDCVNEEVSANGRELKFSNIPLSKYQGQFNVGVRVGDRASDNTVPVTLSRIGRKKPAAIAVGFLLALIALIVWLVRRQPKALSEGRVKGAFLSSVFLDPETNTYSLSKFQFYAWTAAAIFGYVYLSTSKTWVQGDLTFADIPGNLPGIIFVSAATTAVAVGITSAKGSKGAGDMNPSLADFVSTGGVIAAERLQFFVWTLIGVGAFIALTLSIEPGSIHGLPTIPENFLYMMGISSFGYLSGKLARKPGPVISNIEAETGSLTLTIHGTNLSPDARFKIDDADVPLNFLNNAAHPNGKPEVVEPDEQPGFAKVLRLILETTDQTAEKWKTGKHKLTLINPDAQKAVLEFSPSPAQTTTPAEESTLRTQPGATASGGGGTTPATTTSGPTITDIAPNTGSATGGTAVTISGTNFGFLPEVSFGGTPAASVTVLTPTTIIAQSPSHGAGAVDLTVKNPDGSTVTSPGGYTYEADVAADEGGGAQVG
jgi:hypothetical protein